MTRMIVHWYIITWSYVDKVKCTSSPPSFHSPAKLSCYPYRAQQEEGPGMSCTHRVAALAPVLTQSPGSGEGMTLVVEGESGGGEREQQHCSEAAAEWWRWSPLWGVGWWCGCEGWFCQCPHCYLPLQRERGEMTTETLNMVVWECSRIYNCSTRLYAVKKLCKLVVRCL